MKDEYVDEIDDVRFMAKVSGRNQLIVKEQKKILPDMKEKQEKIKKKEERRKKGQLGKKWKKKFCKTVSLKKGE